MECLRWLERRGRSVDESAALLGIAPRTAARWKCAWRERRLQPRPRGRRPKRASRLERGELLETLDRVGTGVGVPALQERFPRLARREIEELRARRSYALGRRRRATLHVLRWTRPGAVWAGDFTQPPCVIDGEYERVVLVRDLASGDQLCASPAHIESAAEVRLAVEGRFLEHGAPLVIKYDNGPGFIAEATRELCAQYGVLILYSPAYPPQYNGSCEAGGGSVKRRCERIAAHQGRPQAWTADDLEEARLQMNACTRPWGRRGPSPEEVWRARRPISKAERAAFQATYEDALRTERAACGIPNGLPLDRATRAMLDRAAIRRALVAHDLLEYRRR